MQDLRVIHVDDSPDDQILALREILREYPAARVEAIRDQAGWERVLREGRFDLAITDFHLGFTDGLAILRELKALHPDCPVIMLTGTGSEEIAVEAMKAGLDDYVLKTPRHMLRLSAAIRGAIDKGAMRRRQREARDELRASEEQFRQLADAVNEVFYVLEPETFRVQYVNRSFEEIWGRSRQELYDGPDVWRDALHPEDRGRAEALRRPGPHPGPIAAEYRIVRPDGSVRWIWDRLFEIRDERHGLVRLVGAAADITGLKEAEQALQKLAAFTRGSPYPVLEFDASGALTYHNAAARPIVEAMRATEPRELLDRTLTDIVQGCLRTGQSSVGVETEAAGRTYTWWFIPVPSAGMVSAYAADITARLELEELLRHAQKMEAVGRLAGGVAHDFNNLLTIIAGCTEILLAESGAESKQRAELLEIRNAADRASSLTRNLLAFSRRQVLRPQAVDLNERVRETSALLRRLLPANVKVELRLDESLGTVRVDPGRIDQVIMNLVLNARDAMPGGGHLALETTNEQIGPGDRPRHIGLRPGRYVTLRVADDGCGMDDATRARMFEPFFTTKERGRGTGLGLSTVHGIVKQSGGDVWVDSGPGRGTRFEVYLPRVDEPAGPAVGRGGDSGHGEAKGGDETILLVEDEPIIRDLTRRALEGRGYTVLTAGGGEEALEAASRHAGPIHLLLTDALLPGATGYELATRLERLRPETKVLFMSGCTDDDTLRAAGRRPGGFFLSKPFTGSDLVQKVRETLDEDACAPAGPPTLS